MRIKQTAPVLMTLLVIAPFAAQAQRSLASTMDVYVFPTAGQTAEEQSQTEAECYGWASKNTGTDPFELAKDVERAEAAAREAQADAKEDAKGSAVKGAAKGAALGAVVGEIADDRPGQGAATGAAVAGVRGRISSRRNQSSTAKESERAVEQAKVASAAEVDKFKMAFSVCLEAKDYLVKY